MNKTLFVNFIICLLLLININIGYSQQDSTCFSDKEVIKIYHHIDSLEQVSEINNKIINEYEKQIFMYESIKYKDSLIFIQQQNQLDIYKDQVKLLQLTIDEVQPKWYDNKTIWFGLGVFLTIFAIKLN